ncbi:uncharacterized protein LOC111336573 isoform X2 [Stylophora pistillata]|nr:uncharacterized protein LOC111336573 isoform X2 [Stylophora pistillata]
MVQNINRNLWFILFAALVQTGTANSPSSRARALCFSHEQCQNGGSCLNQSCFCANGYYGPKCENKRQCDKNFPCQNNGTCELDRWTNTSFCNCNQYSVSDGRFEGVFCEKKAPCHANVYCLNGGVCRRDPYLNGVFFCKCRHGFSGPDCREITSCRNSKVCLNGARCISNKCSCDGDSHTGHFCELEVTSALNYSTVFHWPFNRLHLGMKGAAKVVRDAQMGNVLDMMKAGGGWVDLGQVNNRCLEDLSKCHEGISMSFWLQFTDGRQVITLINKNITLLSVHVKDYKNIFIRLKAGSSIWNIKRSCFPMGWFHLAITWNHRKLHYYENGHQVRVSSASSALIREDASPFGNSTKLSVGGNQGQGAFSTLRMSDLALWTRALSIEEVGDVYKKKLSSPLTTRCLLVPCSSNQWCEDISNDSRNFTCIEPAGFYCSFDNSSCQWLDSPLNNSYWKIVKRYGSLRHDHTTNSCAGSQKFLGLVSSKGRLSSDVIIPPFSKSSVLWKKVAISMWYYMEGWTNKTLYVILQTSAEYKEVFTVKQRQNRLWTYWDLQVPVNSSFQVILRGEINGSGGIFVDDISVETFSSPAIIPRKVHYFTTLQNSTSLVCAVYNASNITWYRNNNPIQQDNHYTIYNEMRGDKNVSVLKVTDTNCQLAGNYTCVTANQFGSVQRQFTLSIFDVPQPPSKMTIDSYSKRIRWTEEPGYECLPKAHFVVEYKKKSSENWTFAGYFDDGVFDLVNVSEGEKYTVRIFAKNFIGRSRASPITFWTNIKPSEIQLFVNDTVVQNSERIALHRGQQVTLACKFKAEPKPTGFTLWVPYPHNVSIDSQHRISEITWKIVLRVKSVSCLNTGSYSIEPRNLLGSERSVSVKLAVSEPDPPKTFNVVFINITSVVISWWAYWCNGAPPRELHVRYRQQGSTVWELIKYKNPPRKVIFRSKFKYKTEYEFLGSTAYNGLRSEYSSVVKIRSPDLTNVTMTSNFTGPANTTLTIYCLAVNLTAVSFSWTKDSMTLQASYRVKFDVNTISSVLTIRFTKKTDSGNYTCKVSNSKTSFEETIGVAVSEPPSVHISPLVRTLFEGDSVSFHCHLLSGNISRLHVTWYEKVEDNPEKLMSDKNDSLSLTVKGTLPSRKDSHLSFYRCLVRNADGVGSSPLAKLVILRKGDEAVCASEESHEVAWSVTSAGMIDEQQCPYAIGQARRRCIKTGPKSVEWGEVDFSDCISLQIREIHDEVIAVTEGYTVSRTLSNILEDLQNASAPHAAPSLGEKSPSMYVKDLTTSVDALRRLIRYNAGQREKPLSNNRDINNLVKTSSNLLKRSNLPAWKNALKRTNDLAYQMISAIDEYGHHSTNKTSDIHVDANNVVLIAVKVSVNSSTSTIGIRITHRQSSLELPSLLFSRNNTSVTVVSVFFSTLGQILTRTKALDTSYLSGSDYLLNSRLASITVRPRPPNVIQPPFKLALETNKVAFAGRKRACVFLNLKIKNNTAWSTDGCNVVSSRTNRTTTSCACDHMTVFGILMAINGDKKEDVRHRAPLSWISIVGCLMSLAGILVTLLVLAFFWKNMRSPRTIVLINLCVAIAMTDVLVVTMEIIDLQSKTGCKVLAALLHFSVLSIFCWMLSEGVQLYLSLVKIIGTTVYANVKVFYALGWGLPSLVVSLSLIVTQGQGYADMQSCWLSTRNHVIWAFVSPGLLIVSVNIVVFTLVISSMLSSHRLRKEPLTRRFQRGLKASFVLLPVLGLSWSFGVLTMATNEIVFSYIFAVLNSLQGFLIFIFHCVLNKQLREVLTERRRKRAGRVTDAMTAQSNRKLSTTTGAPNSQLGSATPLRLLNLHQYSPEISLSRQPSPPSCAARAFGKTSLVSTSLDATRVDQNNLLQTGKGKEEKNTNSQETSEQVTYLGKTDESFKPCDIYERDWTSLESSSESIIDFNAGVELEVNR